MKAMIFAAGKGTRLRPITDNIPKAMVNLNGKPLIAHVIEHLKNNGIDEIIINLHYLPESIIEYLKSKNYFDIRIEFSFEKELLDTGGGLKKAAHFFNDGKPFVVYNTDVVSNIDLTKMLEFHEAKKGIATLAVRKRETNRYLLFDDEERLCGWENISTNEKKIFSSVRSLEKFAFSGIHIIEPGIFNVMPDKSNFSMIELYLSICERENVFAYNHSGDKWFDIGTVEKLKTAETEMRKK